MTREEIEREFDNWTFYVREMWNDLPDAAGQARMAGWCAFRNAVLEALGESPPPHIQRPCYHPDFIGGLIGNGFQAWWIERELTKALEEIDKQATDEMKTKGGEGQ